MSSDPHAPFFFPGGEPGIVLVHGYLTAPDEMRPLGESLARAGATVLGVRLRGHGAQPEALVGVRWQEWVADVAAGVAELRQHCRRVSLAGLSLGAALAFHVAARQPVERLAVFSAPDSALVKRTPLIWAGNLAKIIPSIPKVGSDVRDADMRRRHTTYRRIYLCSVAEVVALLKATDPLLPRVTAPTLLVYSRNDRVVPPRTAARIAARLGGPTQLLELRRGGHTVVMDYDRERAFRAARDWLI